jgi:hypothetical protein
LEWGLGLPVEFTILGGWACCSVIDSYVKFIRPLKKALALIALRKKAVLKKKPLKRQKQAFAL